MKNEYEIKVLDVNIDALRSTLLTLNATKIYDKTLLKRTNFTTPKRSDNKHSYARVRQEANKRITMAYKMHGDINDITEHKELEMEVSDYDTAYDMLINLGCYDACNQENYREKWMYNNSEIVIDWWPYLEPYIEIEADTEGAVYATLEALGLHNNRTQSGTVTSLYTEKYGITDTQLYSSSLSFDTKHPYISSL